MNTDPHPEQPRDRSAGSESEDESGHLRGLERGPSPQAALPDEGGTAMIFSRIVDGDSRAMDDFFIRYQARVSSLVCEMTGSFILSKVEESDLVQEVLGDLWRTYRHMFEPGREREVRSLLSKIVKSKIADEHRRWTARKRSDHGEVALQGVKGSIDPADAGRTPAKQAERREYQDALKRNLERLSADHRRVLYLTVDRQLSIEAAAEEMQTTPDAVSAMKLRALKALKRFLAEDDVTGSKIE